MISYLGDWLIHHPSPQSFTPTSSSANKYARPCRLCSKQKKSELDLTQDIQFLGIRLRLDLGEASLPESKAWEIVAHTRHLSSLHVLTYTQVSQLMGSLSWASGLIPLGCRTDQFTPPHRSDSLVLANLLRRWQDPRFLTSGIPLGRFQAEFAIFTDTFMQGWGAHRGDSQILGTWTHSNRKLHINCLEPKAVIHARQHWAQVLQGQQVMIATDNSTVVSYINKQEWTHSPTLLRLTVEHNSPSKAYPRLSERDSRQPISSEPATYRQSGPSTQDRGSYLQGLGHTRSVHMFATLLNSHLPRFMSPIPEPRALAVDALSQGWQGRSMYLFPPFPLLSKVIQELRSTQAAEVVLIAPWWPSQLLFPHLPRLCVEHPCVLSLPSRSSVPARSEACLGWKVVPSARMEVLMRHYKAAGFSDEVFRLAAAPKRPSTNRMYDDR